MNWVFMLLLLLIMGYFLLKKKNYVRAPLVYTSVIFLIAAMLNTFVSVKYYYMLILLLILILINVITLSGKKQSYYLINIDPENDQKVSDLRYLIRSISNGKDSKLITINTCNGCRVVFYNIANIRVKLYLSEIDNFINVDKNNRTLLGRLKPNIPIIVVIVLIIVFIISELFMHKI